MIWNIVPCNTSCNKRTTVISMLRLALVTITILAGRGVAWIILPTLLCMHASHGIRACPWLLFSYQWYKSLLHAICHVLNTPQLYTSATPCYYTLAGGCVAWNMVSTLLCVHASHVRCISLYPISPYWWSETLVHAAGHVMNSPRSFPCLQHPQLPYQMLLGV